jgi:hypothetical protein
MLQAQARAIAFVPSLDHRILVPLGCPVRLHPTSLARELNRLIGELLEALADGAVLRLEIKDLCQDHLVVIRGLAVQAFPVPIAAQELEYKPFHPSLPSQSRFGNPDGLIGTAVEHSTDGLCSFLATLVSFKLGQGPYYHEPV